ncbi:hypothetical protein WH47_02218, partial [Habropoda laboriosa]
SCVYIVAFTGLCGQSVGDGGVVGVDDVENCVVGLRLRAFKRGCTRRFLHCLYPFCCSRLKNKK